MKQHHEPDLSLDARSIIDAARLEEGPSGVEVERLRGRVFMHLGIAFSAGAAATLATATATTAEAAVASTVATTATAATTATMATTVTAAKVIATTSATVVGAGAGGTALSGSSAAASVATTTAVGFFAKLGLGGASATAAKLAIAMVVVGASAAGVVSVSRDDASVATPVAVTGSGVSPSSDSDPNRSDGKPASSRARDAAPSNGEIDRGSEPAAKAVVSPPELSVEPKRPDARGASATPVAATESVKSAQVDDPLAEETALVARAQSALASGRYDEALSALDDHQRRFPNGVLSQERNGARLLALCGSGRRAQAHDAVAAFLAREPSSPLASRLRSVCAVGSTERSGSP